MDKKKNLKAHFVTLSHEGSRPLFSKTLCQAVTTLTYHGIPVFVLDGFMTEISKTELGLSGRIINLRKLENIDKVKDAIKAASVTEEELNPEFTFIIVREVESEGTFYDFGGIFSDSFVKEMNNIWKMADKALSDVIVFDKITKFKTAGNDIKISGCVKPKDTDEKSFVVEGV